MYVESKSTSSIRVDIFQAIIIHMDEQYPVWIKGDPGKHCLAPASTLSCTITGLLPAHQYTVQAIACLNETSGPDPCNKKAVEGKVWTKPSGKDLLQYLSDIVNLLVESH